MIELQFLVLKGRHLLAQGKRRRSVALGWKTGLKIVREKKFIQENFLLRTKWINSIFLQIMLTTATIYPLIKIVRTYGSKYR